MRDNLISIWIFKILRRHPRSGLLFWNNLIGMPWKIISKLPDFNFSLSYLGFKQQRPWSWFGSIFRACRRKVACPGLSA
jgi:hypothetical protein